MTHKIIPEPSGGGVTDHGALTGLADNDHPQYQLTDADLTAIAALDSATSGAIASDGAGWIKKTYAQFKTALGLVKADVGLGNVDNTSDAAKPVSTAQQTALDAKQALSDKGANNGYASLDAGGDVPATQLGNAPAGSSSLLGYAMYNPTTQASPATSSTSFVDIDATNLAITFVMPPSGKVLLRASLFVVSPNTVIPYFNFREGTTDLADTSQQAIYTEAGNMVLRVPITAVLTGTPGASRTIKAGFRTVSGTVTVRAGGSAGPTIIEAWAI